MQAPTPVQVIFQKTHELKNNTTERDTSRDISKRGLKITLNGCIIRPPFSNKGISPQFIWGFSLIWQQESINLPMRPRRRSNKAYNNLKWETSSKITPWFENDTAALQLCVFATLCECVKAVSIYTYGQLNILRD